MKSYPTDCLGHNDVVLKQLEASLVEMSDLIGLLKKKVTTEFSYAKNQIKNLTCAPTIANSTTSPFFVYSNRERVDMYEREVRASVSSNKELQHSILEDCLGPLLKSHGGFEKQVQTLKEDELDLNTHLLKLQADYVYHYNQLKNISSSFSPTLSGAVIETASAASSSASSASSASPLPQVKITDNWIDILKSQFLNLDIETTSLSSSSTTTLVNSCILKDTTIDAWNSLVDATRHATIKHQILLTRAQELQEQISSTIISSLKKYTIAECGYLASRQFEAQKLYEELDQQSSLSEVQAVLKSMSSSLYHIRHNDNDGESDDNGNDNDGESDDNGNYNDYNNDNYNNNDDNDNDNNNDNDNDDNGDDNDKDKDTNNNNEYNNDNNNDNDKCVGTTSWHDIFPFLMDPLNLPLPLRDTSDNGDADHLSPNASLLSPSFHFVSMQELHRDVKVRYLKSSLALHDNKHTHQRHRHQQTNGVAPTKSLLKALYEMSYNLNDMYDLTETTTDGLVGEFDVWGHLITVDDDVDSNESLCPSNDDNSYNDDDDHHHHGDDSDNDNDNDNDNEAHNMRNNSGNENIDNSFNASDDDYDEEEDEGPLRGVHLLQTSVQMQLPLHPSSSVGTLSSIFSSSSSSSSSSTGTNTNTNTRTTNIINSSINSSSSNSIDHIDLARFGLLDKPHSSNEADEAMKKRRFF